MLPFEDRAQQNEDLRCVNRAAKLYHTESAYAFQSQAGHRIVCACP